MSERTMLGAFNTVEAPEFKYDGENESRFRADLRQYFLKISNTLTEDPLGPSGIGTLPTGAAAGDTLYGVSAGVWGRLPKGTARQLYQMNAGGTLPEWTSAASLTSLVLTSGLTLTGATVTGQPTWSSTQAMNISGNAASATLAAAATILANARTINGVSFDGSANIAISATGITTGNLPYAQLPSAAARVWALGGDASFTGGVLTVAGLTSSALLTASLGAHITRSLRMMAGAHVDPVGGTSIEMDYRSNGTPGGYLTAYDRDLSAYKPMTYTAATHQFGFAGGAMVVRLQNLVGSYGGIVFNKASSDTTTFPSMSYEIDSALKWSHGIDIANVDYVLAYDQSVPGDVLRLSPGGKMVFGPGIGSPSGYTYDFTLDKGESSAAPRKGGMTIRNGTLGITLDLIQSYNSTIFGVPNYTGGAVGMRTNQSLMFGTNDIVALTISNAQIATFAAAVTTTGLLTANGTIVVPGTVAPQVAWGGFASTDVGLRKEASAQLGIVTGDNSAYAALKLSVLTTTGAANVAGLLTASVGAALTNGDLKLQTAGNGIYVKEGTNATMGRAVLVAGTVTVNTTKVTAISEIFLTTNVTGGTIAGVYVSARTPGTSFVITSLNIFDTSTVSWIMMEPA